MHSTLRRLLLGILALFTAASTHAQLNVGPGQAYTTIQSAIVAAKDGTTITVAPGTYFENVDFLGKYITLTSSGGAAVTIIDGSQGSGPAVTITPETATHLQLVPTVLNGFTIQNGGVEPSSTPTGGIYIASLVPSITNNVITHNHCAGIWALAAINGPTIQNNEIDNTLDNHGDCAGGGGSAIVAGRYGNGCVNCTYQPFLITGNTIQNNTQAGQESAAMGVLTIEFPATLQNNTLRSNASAGNGGGIYVNVSAVYIVQNLIANNQAGCGGGGISLDRNALLTATAGIVLIASNTIVNNSAGTGCTTSTSASQVALADTGSQLFSTLFVNNIVSGGSSQPAIACGLAGSVPTTRSFPDFDHNLTYNSAGAAYDTATCMDPTGTYGNFTANPQFVNPAAFNFTLAATSPAVDAGNNSILTIEQTASLDSVVTATDFAGNARLSDATGKGYTIVDMGAYELPVAGDSAQTTVSLTDSVGIVPGTTLSAAGGSTTTLTATVANPLGGAVGCQGSVVFAEDGAAIGTVNLGPYNGTISLLNVLLAPGIHRFTAAYGAQSPCSAAVSVPLLFLVSNYAPQLTLTSSLNPAAFGQSVTFTVKLSSADPNQTGPVTLTDTLLPAGLPALLATLTPNAAGTATFAAASLAAGSHSIVASYAGDATHNATSAGLIQVVTAETVALAVAPYPAFQGQTVTLTATLSGAGAVPNGNIIFLDGTVTVGSGAIDASGHATVTTSTLAVGTHSLTAAFGSATSPIVQEVILASTFTLALSPATVTLQPGQSGSVQILLTSVGNFSGPVALSYGALPAYATAAIAPTTVPLGAGGAAAATLTLNTALRVENRLPSRPGMRSLPVVFAAVGLMLWGRRRKRCAMLLGVCLALVALQSLTGCTNTYYAEATVARGAYQLPITATDANHNTETAILTVTIP
jgi:parallel beta-helix repeat protein